MVLNANNIQRISISNVGGKGVTIKQYGNSPYIGENGNWFVFNDTTQMYEDTGISASGQHSDIDYETAIINKPQINSVELRGNKTFEDLGLESVTEQEIDNLIYGG